MGRFAVKGALKLQTGEEVGQGVQIRGAGLRCLHELIDTAAYCRWKKGRLRLLIVANLGIPGSLSPPPGELLRAPGDVLPAAMSRERRRLIPDDMERTKRSTFQNG